MSEVRLRMMIWRGDDGTHKLFHTSGLATPKQWDLFQYAIDGYVVGRAPCGLSVYEGTFRFEIARDDVATVSIPSGSYRDPSFDEMRRLLSLQHPFEEGTREWHAIKHANPAEVKDG